MTTASTSMPDTTTAPANTQAKGESYPLIAMAGNPNCGKTALFNLLTRSRQKVANYAGVTVERKEGRIDSSSGRSFRLLDLPGTYSLHTHTIEEKVARDALTSKEDPVSAAIAVVDATHLERSLGIVLELKAVGLPIVLALNMSDLAKSRGFKVDLTRLSKELEVPVVETSGLLGTGLDDLLLTLESWVDRSGKARPAPQNKANYSDPEVRFKEIDRVLRAAVQQELGPDNLTSKLDRVLLHPVWGSLVLSASLFVVFQAVFAWAAPFADWIDGAVSALGAGMTSALPEGAIQSLVVDGIIAGVGAVLVFLPQILFLYLFILVLEDSGYMARGAFLIDTVMRRVGLNGRAFIPLLSSFACAIPGIMATRTIESRRDRWVTIFIAPLMACSARLPVYALLISAFIPNTQIAGFIGLQGLTLFVLYFLGIVAAFAVAWVMKFLKVGGPHNGSLVFELPSYKVPAWRNVLRGLSERAVIFLRRAGGIIFVLSIVLWILSTYPKAPEGADEPAIHYSAAGRIGHTLEPIFRPLGFDWQVVTGLVPGFAAREVMVSALATVYAVGDESSSEEEVEASLSSRIGGSWSLASALSLLIWYVFSPQCISTFAVVRRETQSWKATGGMFFYLLALAYVASLITYQITAAIGLG
jgi:ferrous iron transport protein B